MMIENFGRQGLSVPFDTSGQRSSVDERRNEIDFDRLVFPIPCLPSGPMPSQGADGYR